MEQPKFEGEVMPNNDEYPKKNFFEGGRTNDVHTNGWALIRSTRYLHLRSEFVIIQLQTCSVFYLTYPVVYSLNRTVLSCLQ